MQAIWKFPLAFQHDDPVCEVQMPVGAVIVRFAVQSVPVPPAPSWQHTPTIWALVDSDAPTIVRRFAVFGTGHPLPVGAQYVGTYDAGPFVWHVFEMPTVVPDQVAALPLEAQNAYRLLVNAGFTQRWDSGAHAWVAPDPEPLTTEQMMAVAELQEHGFGAVVSA